MAKGRDKVRMFKCLREEKGLGPCNWHDPKLY